MPKTSARKIKRRSTNKRVSRKKTRALSKNIKKSFTLVAVFFLSLTFLGGYSLYKKYTQDFASAFSSSSKDVLAADLYSVLLLEVPDFESEPLVVKKADFIIIDKDTSKLISFSIPVNISVDAPGRFGEEPISNVLALGMLEYSDLNRSIDLISGSVVKLMAFPVDRYVVYEEKVEGSVEDFFEGRVDLGRKDELYSIKDHIKTNFSFKELIDTYSFSTSLPKDRMIKKELSSTYLDNPNLLDEELMDLTFDSLISREKKSIAVLNGTSIPGVASYGSRLIGNIGGRVVAVGNTSDDYEKSVIITDDPTTESTIILKRIFGIDTVISRDAAGAYRESEIARSDVTVIFGLDFAKSL